MIDKDAHLGAERIQTWNRGQGMFLKQCKIAQDTSRLTARTKVLTFDGNNEFLFVYIRFGSRGRVAVS